MHYMDEFVVPKKVKHTIKDLRVRAGLSQDEAALKLNINKRTLQKWENDPTKLSVGVITKLSELYGIPTDYIFFGPNTAFSVTNG